VLFTVPKRTGAGRYDRNDLKLKRHSPCARCIPQIFEENAMSISRRSLVASAAVMPALAVPAAATAVGSREPDPIFAAIDRCRETLAKEEACCRSYGDAELAFIDRHGRMFPSGLPKVKTEFVEAFKRKANVEPSFMFRTHEQITALKGDADLKRHVPSLHRELNLQTRDYEDNVQPFQEASSQATGVRVAATFDVFDVVPTSLAGVRAKIDFILGDDCVTDLLTSDDEDAPYEVIGNLLETLYEAARQIEMRS
jgi:hypothetical protein